MLNKEDIWGSSVTEFFDYAEEKEQLLWSYLFEKIIEVTPRSYKKQILPIIEKIGEKPFRKVLHNWLEIVILAKPKTAFYEDELGLRTRTKLSIRISKRNYFCSSYSCFAFCSRPKFYRFTFRTSH